MAIFDRASFNTLVVELQSDEVLAILDTDYVEDYNGVDGQVTIYHIANNTSWAVAMSLIPTNLLKGQIALAGLPDGNYDVRGRVRDAFGNYSILTSFLNPTGGEDIILISFTIMSGVIVGWITGVINSYPRISGVISSKPRISGTIRIYSGTA